MNLNFIRPILVLAAFAVPVLTLALRRFFKPLFSLTLSLGAPGGPTFKAGRAHSRMQQAAFVMELAGVFVLLIASAGPRLISRQIVYLDRGADILFVLDCSPSMAALDMAGKSRFDTARELIVDFARERPADAIGLVAVGNDAALLLPPVTDRLVLEKRLENIKLGEFGDGTALGMGLATAALHLSSSRAGVKAVALITDGENNAGAVHPETAAAALRYTALKPADAVPPGASGENSFFVFAVGTSGEVPVDYTDPRTGLRRSGTFDSHYDEAVLARIAEAGGGIFIAAPTLDALKSAFSTLGSKQVYISRSAVTERAQNIHFPFIVTGLALLCLPYFWRRLILGAFL
ncbi:MAG: VWA domain-containing protein [Spirochaetaceae bacterium]|jgi:Ca-activated chloride channel family protein|nr:VWA domain-containing protein [Spirochaetaceae bacterium]